LIESDKDKIILWLTIVVNIICFTNELTGGSLCWIYELLTKVIRKWASELSKHLFCRFAMSFMYGLYCFCLQTTLITESLLHDSSNKVGILSVEFGTILLNNPLYMTYAKLTIT